MIFKHLLRPLLIVSALLAGVAPGVAFAQQDSAPRAETEPSWGLRICAQPNAMPFSHVNETGLENRVAQVIADELNAQVVYDWHVFNADLVNLRFSEGICDVIMGVPDGFGRSLNTLTYYQSPYVSVHRSDAGFELESMDDPVLQELSIAILGPATPPHEALLMRGLHGNVTMQFGNEEGEDNLAALVNAVASGAVDIGFGWGPIVGYYAARQDVPLTVAPVEPMFDLPSLFQMQPITMAVRPYDYAMQTRLNHAIAARWDEIQDIVADFNIPVIDTPAPSTGPVANSSGVLNIGVILPIPTGAPTREARAYDLLGTAARQGAQLAESIASQRRETGELDVRLLLASSPSASAAEQQARAMISLGEVDAIVGGLGTGQAQVLAALAADAGIPFINIGSTSIELRQQCHATTFHVQPPATTYVAAMIELYGSDSQTPGWYVIFEDTAENGLLVNATADLIVASGGQLVGSRAVTRSRPVYHDLFAEAEQLQADTIMLILDPADQLAAIGQAEDAGYEFRFAPFPDPLTQLRDFLAAGRRYGVALDVPRLQLWEATLDSERAADLNERYAGQWGVPMDPIAWAAIEGVLVLTEAARLADSNDAEALMSALYEVDAGAIGGKEAGQHFSPDTRELPQQLYVVGQNMDNTWGIRLSQQINVATLLDTVTTDGTGYLDACQ